MFRLQLCNGSFILVDKRRSGLGFPDVKLAKSLLDTEAKVVGRAEAPVHMNNIKNGEIPVLADYLGTAEDDFWKMFPKRELPSQASTRINVGKLKQHVEDVKEKMSFTEVRRAERTPRDLTVGASAFQKSELPPLSSVNSKLASDNGALLTDLY